MRLADGSWAVVGVAAVVAAASDQTQPSLASSIVGLAFFIIVIGIIVWAFLRSRRNRPINELRDRYAKGQIDQAEFEARMDDLRRGG